MASRFSELDLLLEGLPRQLHHAGHCWGSCACEVLQDNRGVGAALSAVLATYLPCGRQMRAEHMMRVKRRIEGDIADGGRAPPLWQQSNPWAAVFLRVSDAESPAWNYWDKNVTDLARDWLCQGRPTAQPIPRSAEIASAAIFGGVASLQAMTSPPVGAQPLIPAHDDWSREVAGRDGKSKKTPRSPAAPGQGQSRSAVQKRRLAERLAASHTGKGHGKGKDKAKKSGYNNRKFTTDSNENELCFPWSEGFGPCADVPAKGPCKCSKKRVHACTQCRSSDHPAWQCPSLE